MSSQAKLVRWAALGVSLAWSLVLYLSGVDLAASTQRYLAYLPTVAVVLAVAFDLWLWKLPYVSRITGRPRIDGSWITTITPHADSHIPEGGDRGPIIAATLIEQTFWTLSITLITAQSDSGSRAAAISHLGDSKRRKRLYYIYDNNPRLEERPRSLVHQGASQMIIVGDRPQKMTGTYWTDRLTMGDMEMRLVDRSTDRHSVEDVLNADKQ